MVDRVSFTKDFLDRAKPIAGKSRTYFYDKKVNGLVICLTQPSQKNPKGVKSFQVYQWSSVKGKPIRVTLGVHPDMKLESARKKASTVIAEIANDIDPNQRKKAERDRSVTLKECFDDYMAVRSKDLAKNTISQYEAIVEKQLASWNNKPLLSISRSNVAKRHADLSIDSPTSANKTMRILRALFNFANGQYEDEQGKGLFPDNPVSKLSHTRAWNKESRRQGKIKNSELESWFEAVTALSNDDDKYSQMVSDYLIFTLLNGLRRREAATLLIEDIDFKDKTFTITKTKNKEPLTLPISDYSLDILNRRKGRRSQGFIFVGKDKKAVNDPRGKIADIRKASKVEFTIHDLRRTFITIAESLDISAYAVKSLVNHSMGGDVTAGYIVMDVERLRKPMQDITNFILKHAGIREAAEVVDIKSKRAKAE